MRKHIYGLVSFIGGILVFMTYQKPKDAVSTFFESLQQLGINLPSSMQHPVTDRVVRFIAAAVVIYCVLHLVVASGLSLRRWWKGREPKYPSPFKREKELLSTMRGNHTSAEGGIIELRQGNKITTREFFRPPIAFRVKAKTNSTNLRLSYVEKEIIFNWEAGFDTLHIQGGPLEWFDEERAGQVPVNEWVTIDLIYQRDSFAIDVDGCNRLIGVADFSQSNQPFSVFQGANSTVHVKSVLCGEPLPMSDRIGVIIRNIVDAIYGEGDPSDGSQWTKSTTKNEPLVERVKYLLALPDPVRITNETLEVKDPAEHVLKKLKLKLRNGACLCIDEKQSLSLASLAAAQQCAPF